MSIVPPSDSSRQVKTPRNFLEKKFLGTSSKAFNRLGEKVLFRDRRRSLAHKTGYDQNTRFYAQKNILRIMHVILKEENMCLFNGGRNAKNRKIVPLV